ncbi:MAG TPA: recombinase family protein [Phycisphaerales bacterium]|nr:recombinase family protein [Phycisphaerales bacterium]
MRQNGTAAVGYARRSTDMQERSIPDQQAYVERWARLNGYRVIRWYIDDAISGTSAKGRAQFERLMHDAENGRDFEAVLCYDMSRFSRGGTNETGYYLHRLSIAGVQALFCADGIPDGEEGELLQGVKSWQARQYSVKLSRDCIRGQHSTVTVRRSGMGGRAPYGYDRQYVSAEGRVIRTVRTLPDGRRQEFGPDGKHVRFIDACQPMGRKMKSDIVRLVPGDPRQVRHVCEGIWIPLHRHRLERSRHFGADAFSLEPDGGQDHPAEPVLLRRARLESPHVREDSWRVARWHRSNEAPRRKHSQPAGSVDHH